ncbi:HEATR4 [Bugula neritina]|uniref:HEATR4 n=1 Tax=Bugula neritina TaxID=10212 RepID=A0A7J7JD15_BUGNE|nr:HEATR4 [Bugula neritina]
MNYSPSRPSLFPCATQVSLIQVGADDGHGDLKAQGQDHFQYLKHVGKKLLNKTKEEQDKVTRPVIQSVSAGLSFTEEVIKELAPFAVPYNEKSIYAAYDTSEFLSQTEKKLAVPPGRFNNYGPDRRHMSCHFKKTTPYKLKPIKREIMRKALEMHKQAVKKEEKKVADASKPDSTAQFFLTETAPSIGDDNGRSMDDASVDKSLEKKEEEKHEWDEYLLSILSRPTAQWIVTQKTDPADQRYKPLYDYMITKHGVPSSTELVRDNMADYEEEVSLKPQVEEPDRRPNTQSAKLLRRVHEMEEREELDTVPYADKTNASFYRLPGGIKKRIKIQEKEMGALNTTATGIIVKKQELPPPPKLRDFVDSRITENTVYETDNNFQRDWLTGNKQVYQAFGNEAEIVMENHNKYCKVQQVLYPREGGEWYPDNTTQDQKGVRSPNLVHKVNKGQKRWTGLPKPVEESETMVIAAIDDIEQSVNPSVEKFQPSEALSKIVDEWRSKWHLNMRFDDATPDDLIKDMEDIHPHVRIKAISTCARASNYKPPPLEGIQLFSVQQAQKSNLPEKIFVALNCLLDDDHPKVRLAAAISLHVLHRPCEKAEKILRFNLQPDQNKADRWAAVQCLGFYGVTDSDVIGECVEQMMNNEDMIQYEKSCSLLSHISNNTSLVHSMLAEHLNDCSWRHRVMALKCLPKLHGDINVDIQNKVMHIMWNDAHSDVRKAAAQSLGKCGYGRLVHDKMREILIEGTQIERAETLSKIGFLGIMTAKLMLPFMRAFRDEYVAVRKEACIAAGNLRIQDDDLISELLRLANRDPIWRIKALAIQALGKIGVVIPKIREALLWALRFEEEEGVRAEACHSIIELQLKDKEVLDILQNRMLVEESPVVQEELTVALELNGVSATEDMAMVAQIKAEVRKLSNRNDIYNSICVLEKDEQLEENTKRMIYVPPTPKTPQQIEDDVAEDEGSLSGELVIDKPDGLMHPLHPAPSVKTYTTSVTEPIPEIDEEAIAEVDREGEGENVTASMSASRQQSARVKSGQPSIKSRPVSQGSSLNTEVIEKELEVLSAKQTQNMEATTEEPEHSLSPHSAKDNRSSRPSTGYSKKKISELRGVSITPTILSVSLDQTQALHAEDPPELAQLKVMSIGDDKGSKSSLVEHEKDESQRHDGENLLGNDDKNITIQTLQLEEHSAKSDAFDPVDATRMQSTHFLFDRYSHIDIKSPDVLTYSPETLS